MTDETPQAAPLMLALQHLDDDQRTALAVHVAQEREIGRKHGRRQVRSIARGVVVLVGMTTAIGSWFPLVLTSKHTVQVSTEVLFVTGVAGFCGVVAALFATFIVSLAMRGGGPMELWGSDHD